MVGKLTDTEVMIIEEMGKEWLLEHWDQLAAPIVVSLRADKNLLDKARFLWLKEAYQLDGTALLSHLLEQEMVQL